MTETDAERIRVARLARGLTQAGLAARLAVSAGRAATDSPGRNQVYRWENGRRCPTMWRPHLERVLGITLLGYRGEPARLAGIYQIEPPEEMPVDRRQFIAATTLAGVAASSPATAKGRRLGRSDVERARTRLADLRRLDDYSGGAAVYPLAVREIGALAALAASGAYTEDVGRQLVGGLGELYQFAAWTAFDAGRGDQARRLALAAANAAGQAGDRTLGATALSELSYLTASSTAPAEGVAMARASMARARDAIPAVRVVLADRLAWASARVGDAEGAARALGAAQEAHDRRDDAADDEPDTVYWINRDESMIMTGRVWSELGRHDRSAAVFEELTAPYDDTHAREMSLLHCWLAGARLGMGEIEGAAASAGRAAELAAQTASPRTDAMITAALGAFEAHRDTPAVAELLDTWHAPV
ncbi:helix-turn-helix transcriptional regulator [Streptomyces sp. MS19]|uniref:helix-turn-helix transcriptional regulator n=1 Tax=Streptomyces sp. MS19 TaxID=3385972 RepID=UPI00399FBBC4